VPEIAKEGLATAKATASAMMRFWLQAGRKRRNLVADWLKILDDEIRAGNKMRKVVPKVLSDPDISLDQVKALFAELEKQAQFVEKLKAALEALGHDFPVVDKARALETRYADLAASAAEKLKEMRQ
jgi:hypothetical protein